jgi:hypothetical protein
MGNEQLGPSADLEALIRGANNYVRPSEDLRPRVLEAARQAAGERRARMLVGRLAALVIVTATLITSLNPHIQPGFLVASQAAISLEAPVFPPNGEAEGDASSWRMVEAFTQLRRQHAQLLRL